MLKLGRQHLLSQPSLGHQPHLTSSTPQVAVNSPNSQPIPPPPSPPNLYTNARQIPNETINVFPDAICDIMPEFWERFDAVQEFLHKGVERKRSKLFRNITNISYDLHMCGTSRTDAKPSIVVSCPKRLVSKLKRLFRQSHFRDQYCSEYACFDIYFWGLGIELLWGHSTRVNMATGGSSDSDHKPSGVTMCGSIITAGDCGERRSTVGLILRVQSEYYALTAAHSFHQSQILQDDVASGKPDLESDSDSGFEYDSDGDMDELDDDPRPINTVSESFKSQLDEGKPRQTSVTRGNRSVQENLETHKANTGLTVRSPPTEDDSWNSTHANCDWALVRLPERHQWRPNVYFTSDPSSQRLNPTFFGKIASRRPIEQRKVAIVSSRSVRQLGVLYPYPSYIGGSRSKTCQVLTVQLSDKSCKFTPEFKYYRPLTEISACKGGLWFSCCRSRH
jgi:hypothetical protein